MRGVKVVVVTKVRVHKDTNSHAVNNWAEGVNGGLAEECSSTACSSNLSLQRPLICSVVMQKTSVPSFYANGEFAVLCVVENTRYYLELRVNK